MSLVIVGVGGYTAVAAGTTGNMKLLAEMQDVTLEIEIPQTEVYLKLDPTASLTVADGQVIVNTTALYGYQLLMTADTDDLTRTQPIDGSTPVIPTLSSDSTPVAFAVNHWGFKLAEETKFRSFDHTGTVVSSSDGPVTDQTNTINFAAKANENTPAGMYQLDLTFAAVINSKPVGIEDVVYMQDFKNLNSNDRTSIFTSMVEGTSYTIKDSRDEQDYTVAKLFDGNIWMTKNLNIAGETELTSDESNVTTTYTLPKSSTAGWTSDSGQYLYNSNSVTCGNNSPCYSYYSFITANAGNNPSAAGNPDQDICPAGWRLPTYDEYSALIAEYDTGVKMTTGPFLGVYGGDYYNNALNHGGTYGYYWSSNGASGTTGWSMGFNSSTSDMYNYLKRTGFSIRCIVK